MTPTLLGRWQTRLLLFVIVGLPVTWWYTEFVAGEIAQQFLIPIKILVTLLGVGLLLDWVYIQIQKRRWDRDWPFAYQLISMIFEFVVVLIIVHLGIWPELAGLLDFPDIVRSVIYHFLCVLIPSFLLLLGPLQTLMIRWRFKGGELTRMR